MLYPRISSQYPLVHSEGVCSICGQPKPDYKIIIETDRHSVLAYRVHKACTWKAQEQVLIKELLGD